MKKSMAKKKMPMTTVNGKKVPAFAADGKGAGDLKKSAAKMKRVSGKALKAAGKAGKIIADKLTKEKIAKGKRG